MHAISAARDRPICVGHLGEMDAPKGSSVLSAEIAWIISLASASSIFVACSAAIKTYNMVRPHLALEKDAPIPLDVHRAGRVPRHDGGERSAR